MPTVGCVQSEGWIQLGEPRLWGSFLILSGTFPKTGDFVVWWWNFCYRIGHHSSANERDLVHPLEDQPCILETKIYILLPPICGATKVNMPGDDWPGLDNWVASPGLERRFWAEWSVVILDLVQIENRLTCWLCWSGSYVYRNVSDAIAACPSLEG